MSNLAMPAGRRLFQPRRKLICAAQWCGLVPALVGTLIVLVWAATRSQLLPLLGALNVLVGIVLFGAGLGLLYGAYMQAGRRLLPGTGLALGLMLGNFPLAAGYGVLGMKLEEYRMRQASCEQAKRAVLAEPSGLADARRRPC